MVPVFSQWNWVHFSTLHLQTRMLKRDLDSKIYFSLVPLSPPPFSYFEAMVRWWRTRASKAFIEIILGEEKNSEASDHFWWTAVEVSLTESFVSHYVFILCIYVKNTYLIRSQAQRLARKTLLEEFGMTNDTLKSWKLIRMELWRCAEMLNSTWHDEYNNSLDIFVQHVDHNSSQYDFNSNSLLYNNRYKGTLPQSSLKTIKTIWNDDISPCFKFCS